MEISLLPLKSCLLSPEAFLYLLGFYELTTMVQWSVFLFLHVSYPFLSLSMAYVSFGYWSLLHRWCPTHAQLSLSALECHTCIGISNKDTYCLTFTLQYYYAVFHFRLQFPSFRSQLTLGAYKNIPAQCFILCYYMYSECITTL